MVASKHVRCQNTTGADWRELEQLNKLVGRQVCIPKDASEQGFLDGLPSVNRHDGSSLCGGLYQYQVAAFLPILQRTHRALTPGQLFAQSETAA